MENSFHKEHNFSREELDRIYHERFLADLKEHGTDEDVTSGLESMKEQIRTSATAGTEIRVPIEGKDGFTKKDMQELSAYRILAKELGYRIGEFDRKGDRAIAPIERIQSAAKTPGKQSAPLEQQAEVIRDEDEAMESVRQNTPERSAMPLPEQTPGAVPPTVEPKRFFDAPAFESLGHQAKEEILALTPHEKRSWLTGMAEFGYHTQEWKGNLFSKAYGWIADTFKEKEKTMEEQGTMVRFYNALGESYERVAKKAHKDRTGLANEKGFVGLIKKGGGVGTFIGNTAIYGRAIYDFFGPSLIQPLRYVTLGAMMIGRAAEAGKEATLQKASKIEAERIIDAEEAAEEAWRIYEEARAQNPQDEVTKEALKLAYAKDLPAHILGRFIEKPESISSTLMQKVAEFDIKRKARDIYTAIFDIEHGDGTPEEKQRAIEGILSRNADFLRDADRMVTKAGIVDMVAYGSKLLETGGKAVVTAMAIETLAEGTWRLGRWTSDVIAGGGIHRLAETASDITGKGNKKIGEIYEYLTFNSNGSPKTEGLKALATDIAETSLPIESPVPREALEAATIGKGEGIEHAFVRQIKLHPEQFGFKGDAHNADALNQFAGVKAHKLAEQFGYVSYKDGTMIETRIRDEGVSYVLNSTHEGHVMLEKIGLREGGLSEYIHIEKPLITEEEAAAFTQEILRREAGGTTVRDAAEASMLDTEAQAITNDMLRREAKGIDVRDADNIAEAADKKEAAAITQEMLERETGKAGVRNAADAAETTDKKEAQAITEDLLKQKMRGTAKEADVRDANETPIQNAETSAAKATLPEAVIEKNGIAATKELIAKTGFSETVLDQFDQSQFEHLTSSHITALDIAARDIGIKGADTDTMKNYLDHALSTFQSGNKKSIAQWIDEAYRSLLIEDMKHGVRLENGTLITQEYIDGQTARLQELLLGRAAEALSAAPDLKAHAIERALEFIRNDAAKYDRDVAQLDAAIGKIQNPSLRQSLESDKWRLVTEKAGLEEVLKHPEKFARIEHDGASVVFEGTYKVTPRPGDVSGIKEFEKPFKFTVPVPKK